MPLRHIDTQSIWAGEPINEVRHPKNIEKLWSPDELAAIGLEVVPPPPAPEPTVAPPRTVCDFIEYMELFTEQEQLAIAAAALSSPALKLWYDQAIASNRIELTSGRVAAGMQTLVDAGLLQADRRDVVLATTFSPKRGV
jgi:hypothetical protein